MATKSEQQRQLMSNLGLDPNASYSPGLSGMGEPGAIYTPTTGVALGNSGVQVGYNIPSSGGNENKYRVGDYTYNVSSGNWDLVQNSPTDVVQKYLLSDASSKQGLSLSDWFGAGKSAAMAWSGLPANSNNLLGVITNTAAGQLLSRNPLTGALWAGGNFLKSLTDSL